MSVFIYTTLFIFILFCNVFFNLKHKKCRHYSFRNSKWRQKGSFLTLVRILEGDIKCFTDGVVKDTKTRGLGGYIKSISNEINL